jgi:hypothetical protein
MGPKILTVLTGLALEACGLAGDAPGANELKGYLSALGPAPLSFQTRTLSALPLPVHKLPANNFAATGPVVPPTNPPPFSTESNLVVASSSVAGAAESPSEPVQPADSAGLGTLPTAPDLGAEDKDPSRIPQSVLWYLVPVWTNSIHDKLLAPIFVPPAPPALPPPPSSHATYESR